MYLNNVTSEDIRECLKFLAEELEIGEIDYESYSRASEIEQKIILLLDKALGQSEKLSYQLIQVLALLKHDMHLRMRTNKEIDDAVVISRITQYFTHYPRSPYASQLAQSIIERFYEDELDLIEVNYTLYKNFREYPNNLKGSDLDIINKIFKFRMKARSLCETDISSVNLDKNQFVMLNRIKRIYSDLSEVKRA